MGYVPGCRYDLFISYASENNREAWVEQFERALGQECLSIAAPFGEASPRFVELAGKVGFRAGFTIEPGVAHLTSEPLRLPRLEVMGGMSLDAFVAAVTGGMRPASATA